MLSSFVKYTKSLGFHTQRNNQIMLFKIHHHTRVKCLKTALATRPISSNASSAQEKTIEIIDGQGTVLFGRNKRRYLDFATGPLANSLGHGWKHDLSETSTSQQANNKQPQITIPWSGYHGNKYRFVDESSRQAQVTAEELLKQTLVNSVGTRSKVYWCQNANDMALLIARRINGIRNYTAQVHRKRTGPSFTCKAQTVASTARGGTRPTSHTRIPRDCRTHDGFCHCWSNSSVDMKEAPTKIVAFQQGTHANILMSDATVGAVSVTHDPTTRRIISPQLADVIFAQYNDVDDAARCITKDVGIVIVEPIQWDGVTVAQKSFLETLRQLCDSVGALLVVDETHCGMGYSGSLWAHQLAQIKPDIVTVRPVVGHNSNAVILNERHVSTMDTIDTQLGQKFPSATLDKTVGQEILSTIQTISSSEFSKNVQLKSLHWVRGLRLLQSKFPDWIRDIHHTSIPGLLLGILVDGDVRPIIDTLSNEGILAEACGRHHNVIRFAPPLTVDMTEIDHVMYKLNKLFGGASLL